MGTSKSYPGPPGRSPLLPPYAPDAPDGTGDSGPDDAPDDGALDTGDTSSSAGGTVNGREGAPAGDGVVGPSVTWRSPSGYARGLARSPAAGGRDRHRAVGRSFVRALGGAGRAAQSARAARATAVSLGGFLSGVARDGIAATAERFGFTAYLGQGVDALLAALVRAFGPPSADLDADVARRAELDTLTELLDRFDVATAGPEALDALDEGAVRETMEHFVANCVAVRLLQVLATKIEEAAVSANRAKEVEDELGEYVRATVTLEFGTLALTDLAWDSREAAGLVQRLFEDAYAVLEAATTAPAEAAA